MSRLVPEEKDIEYWIQGWTYDRNDQHDQRESQKQWISNMCGFEYEKKDLVLEGAET